MKRPFKRSFFFIVKVKRRIFAFLSAFIISINTICVVPLQVYASSGLTDFDEWSNGDKFYYYTTHFIPIVTQCVGVVFSPSLLMWDNWLSLFEEYAADEIIASGCSSYEDYIASKMGLNDAGELVIDDELADLMYETTNEYIEEYTGWYNVTTSCHTELQAVDFATAEHYSTVKILLSEGLGDNDCIPVTSLSYSASDDSEDGVKYGIGRAETFDITDYMFVCTNYNETYNYIWFNRYDENWELDVIGEGSYTYYEFLNNEVEMHTSNQWVDSWYGYSHISTKDYSKTGLDQFRRNIFTSTPRQIRVYKTVDDMKSYSVGQRTYYTSSQFYDYSVDNDNSCSISESQLNGSSVYGDVTNIIINNYTDPDGLSEDELREILDEYFKDKGSSGGSSDDDDDDDSGGGLFDFLDGLGSFFDGILSVLGKLLEYIGKAVTLVTDTLSSIVDKIPASVTGMMTAVFPMLPEEWFSIIELALVLGVLGIVIKLLKG